MPRKLKVYGWSSFRHGIQTREIMAAQSAAEVQRIAGITRATWEWSGCETGNDDEVATAMAEPRVIFWKSLAESIHHNSKVPWARVEPKS